MSAARRRDYHSSMVVARASASAAVASSSRRGWSDARGDACIASCSLRAHDATARTHAGLRRRELLDDQRGAQLVEYVVCCGLVALGVLAGFRVLSQSLQTKIGAQSIRVETLEAAPSVTDAMVASLLAAPAVAVTAPAPPALDVTLPEAPALDSPPSPQASDAPPVAPTLDAPPALPALDTASPILAEVEATPPEAPALDIPAPVVPGLQVPPSTTPHRSVTPPRAPEPEVPPPSSPGPPVEPERTAALDTAMGEIRALFGLASDGRATRAGARQGGVELARQEGVGSPLVAAGVRIEGTRIVSAPTPAGGLASKVTFEAEQTVTVFAEGSVDVGAVSLARRASSGETYSLSVTAPEAVAAQIAAGARALGLFDPSSIPAETSVMVRTEDVEGSSLEAAFRRLALASDHTTQAGMAIGVARLDEDELRVVSGPTEAVSNSISIGLDLGMVGASIGGGATTRNETLRVIDFDVSTAAGRTSYQRFLLTGALPVRDLAAGVLRTGGSMVVERSASFVAEARAGIGAASGDTGWQWTRWQSSFSETTFDDGTVEAVSEHVRPGAGQAFTIAERFDSEGSSGGATLTYSWQHLEGDFLADMIEATGGPASADLPSSFTELTLSADDAQAWIEQARAYARQAYPTDSEDQLQAWLAADAMRGPGAWHSFVAELALARNPYGVAEALGYYAPGAVAQGMWVVQAQTGRPLAGTVRWRRAE